MIHKNANGEREHFHKFPLQYIVKEVNIIPCNKIEESPESLLEWYIVNTNSLTSQDEVDGFIIVILMMAECWLINNNYISEGNKIIEFHFEKTHK